MNYSHEMNLISESVSESQFEQFVSSISKGDSFDMAFDPESTYFFVSKNGDTVFEELTEEVAQSLVTVGTYLEMNPKILKAI